MPEPEPGTPAGRLQALTGGLPVPRLAKVGAVTILLGLLADVSEHSFAAGTHAVAGTGFALGEHVAHLVVLVGMVVVLVGVIADGTRRQGRDDRPEGSPRDAVR